MSIQTSDDLLELLAAMDEKIRSRLQEGGPPVRYDEVASYCDGLLETPERRALSRLISKYRAWNEAYREMALMFAGVEEGTKETVEPTPTELDEQPSLANPITGKIAQRMLSDQRLWEHYLERLTGMALMVSKGRKDDFGIQHVFRQFWFNTEQGRFPDWTDTADLWKLLIKIVALKQPDRNTVHGFGDTTVFAEGKVVVPPAPDEPVAEALAIELERLLELLDNDNLRELARLHLEGQTIDEIAAKLGSFPERVVCMFQLVIDAWREELAA